MKRFAVVILLCAAVTGCAAGHAVAPEVGPGGRPSASSATELTVSHDAATPSPAPSDRARKDHEANAAEQKKAATPVPGAPKSGMTQPNSGPAQVERNGHPAKPSLHAGPAAFGSAIRYPDGVRVQVMHIGHTVSTGNARGDRPGQPVTVFEIRISNGSTKTLGLDQVVVSALVSTGSALAQPIYFDGVNDFAGTVAPGGSATTSYAFTIPASALGSVQLRIDFDGSHSPALFDGSAR